MALTFRTIATLLAASALVFFGSSCDPQNFENTTHYYQPHGGSHGDDHGESEKHDAKGAKDADDASEKKEH